jgi:hypothetical protein
MQKFAAIASVGIVAAADGKFKLAWNDCGDANTHGQAHRLYPTSLQLGDSIRGSFVTDKQVKSGSFAMKLTAGDDIKMTFTGKLCESKDKEFKLPLDSGMLTLSWAGLDCPVKTGASPAAWSIGLNMTSTSHFASGYHLAFTASDQDDEKLLCFNAHVTEETCNAKDTGNVCCQDGSKKCGLGGIPCRDAPVTPYQNNCGLETEADNCCFHEGHFTECTLCGVTTPAAAVFLA